MSAHTLSQFSDKLNEIMPVISKEFLKHQTGDLFKARVTMPQVVVLDVLFRHPESKMTELARAINVTTAAVTGIIERLVRDGYVKRLSDPADRRITKVSLTGKGASTMRKMNEHRKHVTEKIFGMITEEERESYIKILEHIRDHLKEQG